MIKIALVMGNWDMSIKHNLWVNSAIDGTACMDSYYCPCYYFVGNDIAHIFIHAIENTLALVWMSL